MIIKKGNYGFDLNFTVQHADGTVYDLTGFTVHLKLWDSDGNLILNQQCMIVNAAQGKCKYTVQSGDFDTEGRYMAELELTKTGWLEDTDTFEIIVAPTV
ncbi:MAG: BppU family phage baseplate upper protein [Candidatus Bathyarchaeia archaeon]